MNCTRCGKFMKRIMGWDEFPDGPYVNTEWLCSGCGGGVTESDNYRLLSSKGGNKDE